MANKLLSNIGVVVGDVVSASLELQTTSGTAANYRAQLVFMDGSDVVLGAGTFDGEVIDTVYGNYAASPDTNGPWFVSRIFNITVPAGAVKMNVGYAFASTTIGTITSSRRAIFNLGSKPAQYSQPSSNIPSLPTGTIAVADFIPFDDDSDGIARRQVITAIPVGLFDTKELFVTPADADYTIVASDHGKTVMIPSTVARNVTIPAGLGVGFWCRVVQDDVGTLTCVASSTTLNSSGSLLETNGQNAEITIKATAADVFLITGDRA